MLVFRISRKYIEKEPGVSEEELITDGILMRRKETLISFINTKQFVEVPIM